MEAAAQHVMQAPAAVQERALVDQRCIGEDRKILFLERREVRQREDFAGLRRDLVDFGYMRRERAGSKYWLTPEDEVVPENA